MSPKRLLQLWRARWDKSVEGVPDRPYARGKVHAWSYQLCDWKIWDSAILRWAILGAASFVFFISLQLEFSINGQITFAAFLVAIIIAARRFEGPLFTFAILAIAAIASAQYFYWRLTKTFVLRSDIELLLSALYCAIELFTYVYLTVRLYNQSIPMDWLSLASSEAINVSAINLNTAIRLKRWATSFEDLVCFYKPIGTLAITLVPIISLLFGYSIFNAKSTMIAPMFAPFLVAMAVMVERLESKRRWGLFKALTEVFLACVLCTRNAIAFIRYSFEHKSLFLKRSFASPVDSYAALKSLTTYGLIGLNFAAVLSAALGLGVLPTVADQIALVLIAIANIILLLNKQAIAHESRHIEWFCERQLALPATLILRSGRTIACQTCNFPNTPLRLKLPKGIEVQTEHQADALFMLQFRHGHRPYNLTVHANQAGAHDDPDGTILLIGIEPASLIEFTHLKDAVMARDAAWPRWLADKNADQLLPKWINELTQSLPMLWIEWMTKFFSLLKFRTVINLFKSKPES